MDIPRKEKILGEEVLITEELIRDAQLAHDLYEKALHTDTSQLTVDDLVEIKDVVIDRTKTKFERIISYLIQIKNPYCVRVGNMKVNMAYADSDGTLDDSILSMLTSL